MTGDWPTLPDPPSFKGQDDWYAPAHEGGRWGTILTTDVSDPDMDPDVPIETAAWCLRCDRIFERRASHPCPPKGAPRSKA